MKGEHWRNSRPAQQFADVDTTVTQPLMGCGGVAAGKAHAGLDAGGNTLRAGSRAIVVAEPGGAIVIHRPPNCGRGTSSCFSKPRVSV
jgi:hypothetical protein